MNNKEKLSFSTIEIGPLNHQINNKLRELYDKGGEAFISVTRDEKLQKAPVLHIDLFNPGITRTIAIL